MKLLLKYQQLFCAAEKSYNVRVWEKSRRIGATWGEAINSLLQASKSNGVDTWYVGYNKEMSFEFIKETGEMAKNLQEVLRCGVSDIETLNIEGGGGIVSDERSQILSYRITLNSGKRITALSSKPTNFRGKKGRVIIDEAAWIDRLGEFLKSAMALTMWGGTVAVISTHNGESEFNQICRGIREGKLPYYLQKTTIDDAIADGMFERVCLQQGITPTLERQELWREELLAMYGDDADEELFCIPKQSGSLYFSPKLIASRSKPGHVIKLVLDDNYLNLSESQRSQILEQWLQEYLRPMIGGLEKGDYLYGMDFGRKRDMGAIALLKEDGAYKEFVGIIELFNCPYDVQRKILFEIGSSLQYFQGGASDATGNAEYLAEEMAKNFGNILQVKATASWYGTAFSKFRAELQCDRMMLIDDPNLVNDLMQVKIQDGIPRIPNHRIKMTSESKIAKKDMTRHCEGAIACLLAFWACERRSKISYDLLPSQRQVEKPGLFWGSL